MKAQLNNRITRITIGALLTLLPAFAVEVDPTFQTSIPGGTVHALVVTSQNDLILGGSFSTVNGEDVRSLAKLTATGQLDPAFALTDVEGAVYTIAVSNDDSIYLGGSLGAMGGNSPVEVGSFTASGAFRDEFAPSGINGRVYSVVFDIDGDLVIGGTFFPEPGSFVAKLDRRGNRKPSFQSALGPRRAMEAGVSVVAVQPDGKLLVGGNFTFDNRFASLARLNADGSIDRDFSGHPGPILYPKVIMALNDGKILVGGTADSMGRGFVRRLLPDGSVDATFAEPPLDGSVEALAVDELNRILIGGGFNHVNESGNAHLARLNPDGSLDVSWRIGANNSVLAIAVDHLGRVVVGGAFSEIGGLARAGIARLQESSSFGFKSMSVGSGGEMHLTLKGEAGQTYIIEKSRDLRSWSQFTTNLATVDGIGLSENGQAARQFFRARLAY